MYLLAAGQMEMTKDHQLVIQVLHPKCSKDKSTLCISYPGMQMTTEMWGQPPGKRPAGKNAKDRPTRADTTLSFWTNVVSSDKTAKHPTFRSPANRRAAACPFHS